MNRWILLRVIGFGAFTFFLIRYTGDKHFNLYDMIPVTILAGLVVSEIFIRKRKSNK